MGATSKYHLPWPELPNVADGPDGYQDLATATEVALKSQAAEIGSTLLYGRRLVTDGVGPSVIGSAISASNANAPAGLYLVTGVAYWDARINGASHCYLWIYANDHEIFHMYYHGAFYQGGAPQTPTCSYLEGMYRHTGGALTVKMNFGYGPYSTYIYNDSTISAQRITA